MTSLTRSIALMQAEPMPKRSNLRPVWELVVADMVERDRIGRAKYGTPLQPFNGRDALVDAYQEALDLAVYLRQAIYERDTMAANLKKTVKIDEKDGKKRVVRVRKFDASKARRIAKSKSKRVVAPAKARAAR